MSSKKPTPTVPTMAYVGKTYVGKTSLTMILSAALCSLGLVVATAGVARAGDFMDTRVTFVFTDDDVLHDAGETTPSSPGPSFGVRRGRIFFFENHNKKDRGDETQSHLVSYRKMPGFIEGLTTEAALVLEFSLLADGQPGLRDDGTYINLIYDLGNMDERTGRGRDLTLTLFPYDTERFQLGYSYRMAWGGSRIFGKERKGPAPGVKLNLDLDGSYVFLGAKTAHIQRFAPEDQPRINDEVDAFYAGLAGAGWEAGPFLFEINGGYFQRGTNPRAGVRGEPVDAAGVSAQVTFHKGLPVRKSADFSLYRQDPMRIGAGPVSASTPENATKKQEAGSAKGILVSSEATYLMQDLEDPDNYGGLRTQVATAGDVNLVAGLGKGLTVFADFIYRDLSFVLFNQPSFVPYQDFSGDTQVTPEFWAGFGFDWTIGDTHITPGATVGVQRPASVTATPEAGVYPPGSLKGRHTVVVREEGRVSILPADTEVTPIWAAKARIRWDLSKGIALIGEAFASVDNNRTKLVDDSAGIAQRDFEDPFLLGFGLVAQARF